MLFVEVGRRFGTSEKDLSVDNGECLRSQIHQFVQLNAARFELNFAFDVAIRSTLKDISKC
jgi:hypothetical protein